MKDRHLKNAVEFESHAVYLALLDLTANCVNTGALVDINPALEVMRRVERRAKRLSRMERGFRIL